MIIGQQHRKIYTSIKESYSIYSYYLERIVLFDVYLPEQKVNFEKTSLLLINDGQDLVKMPFENILNSLYQLQSIEPLVCIGIHCGSERIREYGTAYSADYKRKGDKAGLYSKFIFDELLPYFRKKYNAAVVKEKSFAGFSLGGLSALDIVWNHAYEFKRVGVFSGSLWWRRRAYEFGYDEENDRLAHLQIRMGVFIPWLEFFLQCGAFDETEDRNKNGIIDSIDDTLDLIVELKAKGYTDKHIRYLELPNGRHDVPTWAEALPTFLQWGWGK